MPRTTNPATRRQTSLRSQVANATRWSRLPIAERTAATQAARDALWAKYLDQVDPERRLPEAEREILARQARRADMLSKALKASRNRTARQAAEARKGTRNGRAT